MKFVSVLFMAFFATSSLSYAAESPLGGKYKSKGPIEINADALEVLQAEHKAIFTGRVVAVQGDVKLTSEKMTVFYKGNPAGGADKADKKEAKPAAATEKNSIEKIIVEKNVFLSTPEETASGDNGIYDVEHHKIFLNDNVVLTKDKNVLKGEHLVYDFETGKSSMNAPNGTIAEGAGNKKTRVKALFVPSGDEKLPFKK